jgi:esterase
MELHFRALGEGPPLILLHGLLGSLDNWLPLGRKFATHFRVFAVDQRNHGLSPHSAEFGYTIMARDLHEFMRVHGLAPAHVLGHSMGGKTAMQFALLYPEPVAKLVVVDMSPRAYPSSHAKTLAALRALDLKAFTRREDIDAALAASVPDAELRGFLLKNVRREATGAFHWKVNLPAIRDNYCHLNAAVDGEKPFLKPALFVRGGKSDYVREPDFEPIRRLFPQAQVRTIPAAGHWVHADAPQEFARAVIDFLTAT